MEPPPVPPEAGPAAAARRPFGDGRPVSLFTLGTMRALESPEAMAAVLEAALAAGINHVETAPAFGPAERFLGQALATAQTLREAVKPRVVIGDELGEVRNGHASLSSRRAHSRRVNRYVEGKSQGVHVTR